MPSIVLAVLGHVGTFVSLLGLYFTIVPFGVERPAWHWVIIAFAAMLMAMTALADLRRQIALMPKKFRNKDEIRIYMKDWLSSGGRATSLSRDLSWVDKANENVLLNKSKNGELTIFVETETTLTQKLRKAGATVFYYGALNYVPRSRFTIIDFERDGARVAVGAPNGPNHVIQEFRSGHHPLFAMAEDLANILIRTSQRAS